MRRANPYKPLERLLGYRFRKRHRLETALTHPSFRHEQPEIAVDNQRLEFLGDAVLNLVTAEWLYEHRQEYAEGRLTQFRSRVTSMECLGEVALDIGLGGYLRMGRGEHQSEGARRRSTLADAFEAVVGAAYLDGGLKAARRIFEKLIRPRLEAFQLSYASDNPKGILQEICQAQRRKIPTYRIVAQHGKPHERIYVCEVEVEGQVLGRGEGPNRKTAEMRAAARAVEAIERGQISWRPHSNSP